MTGSAKLVRDTAAYSREGAIARPGARTKEARFLAVMRDRLTTYVGGTPSPVQALLIERIAWTMLRIELMDAAALKTEATAENQSRAYADLSETAAHLLRQLAPSGMLSEIRSNAVVSAVVEAGAAA